MPINNNNNNTTHKSLYLIHIITRNDYEYMNKQSEEKKTYLTSLH